MLTDVCVCVCLCVCRIKLTQASKEEVRRLTKVAQECFLRQLLEVCVCVRVYVLSFPSCICIHVHACVSAFQSWRN